MISARLSALWYLPPTCCICHWWPAPPDGGSHQFHKILDPVIAEWLANVRAITVITLLAKEADKLNFGEQTVPDSLTLTWKTQYQELLLDQPCIHFHKSSMINPASFLPDINDMGPLHDCLEIIQSSKPDLTDVSVATPNEILFR